VLVRDQSGSHRHGDERGFIELANAAAVELLIPRAGNLIGDPIAGLFCRNCTTRYGGKKRRNFALPCNAGRTAAMARPSPRTSGSPLIRRGRAPNWRRLLRTRQRGSRNRVGGSRHRRTRRSSGVAALNGRRDGRPSLAGSRSGEQEIAARMEMSESTVKNTIPRSRQDRCAHPEPIGSGSTRKVSFQPLTYRWPDNQKINRLANLILALCPIESDDTNQSTT